MSIIDMFTAEDKVEVKFSQLYELVKGCTERDLMMNAIKSKVPHRYIYASITGKSIDEES